MEIELVMNSLHSKVTAFQSHCNLVKGGGGPLNLSYKEVTFNLLMQ